MITGISLYLKKNCCQFDFLGAFELGGIKKLWDIEIKCYILYQMSGAWLVSMTFIYLFSVRDLSLIVDRTHPSTKLLLIFLIQKKNEMFIVKDKKHKSKHAEFFLY